VTATATSVAFTFPALPSGKYTLRVYIPNVGDAILGELTSLWNGEISNDFWVGAAVPATGSSAGAVITIAVNGLNVDRTPRVTFGKSGECAYVSHTSSQIVCRTPAITGADTFTVTQDVSIPVANQVKLAGGSYTGSATGAATVSAATSSVTGATTTVTLTGTSLQVTAATTVVFELKSNRNVAYAGVVTAATATSATVTITDLAAGEYVVRYLVPEKGFAIFSTATPFSVIVNLAPQVAVTFDASIAGGQTLTITGSGFSTVKTQNKVTIGGLVCPVQTATPSQITCTVPQFATKLTKALYKFPENESIVEPVAQFSN
jgi:uncharacterized protein (DUF2141 family)